MCTLNQEKSYFGVTSEWNRK